MENAFMKFNEQIWGYDFTCKQCGKTESSEGEGPISVMDAMRERGWTFKPEGKAFIPFCPLCKA